MARSIGDKAEAVAEKIVLDQGLKIIDRNVFYPFGEIDIVAKDKAVVVFIEVKYRKSLLYGHPADFVTASKQKKIIKAAQAYLKKNYFREPYCRFDVLSLWGDINQPSSEYLKDAFVSESSHGF